MRPLIAILFLLLGGLALLTVWWLSSGGRETTPTSPQKPSPTAVTASPTSAPPAAEVTPSSAYRLAGVAVGDDGSFAVFEDPSGKTTLYDLGAEVPGLGKLTKIERRRAVVTGPRGDIEFVVRPAPSPTRGAQPRGTPTRARATPRAPTRAATPPPASGRTAAESRP